MLERNLGLRLFHRSTRKLVRTEASEHFLQSIGGNLDALQAAIADISSGASKPAGMLKVGLSPTFGADFILPHLPDLLRHYPRIRPEWHFENRHLDLATEGYDTEIGAGFDLTPGIVAAPGYMAGRPS
ncbi:LysR family transcriptional regulator [Paracoccus sp. PAR01]|uniref:LysR family transcriptional regulator n=1 Tax=Paracoccus sp. PAR01 TaxID=2769282 RepID=UPI001CE1645A|nr:LysR family transcriptional regulator [Paracoccus sp. PAR01]